MRPVVYLLEVVVVTSCQSESVVLWLDIHRFNTIISRIDCSYLLLIEDWLLLEDKLRLLSLLLFALFGYGFLFNDPELPLECVFFHMGYLLPLLDCSHSGLVDRNDWLGQLLDVWFMV